jgi:hypothetical protein
MISDYLLEHAAKAIAADAGAGCTTDSAAATLRQRNPL